MAKGKAAWGSPRWLSNKMKSKGLQKLRWYCQMCQKQCRDQNGFKCHITSESHQRQMMLFSEKPGQYIYNFSREFERDFMDILRRCHGTKRVFANTVYQEYIRDKEHIHMNATRWASLAGFVRYLGSTGKAKIEETEKGWYITWIDREYDTVAREKARAKRDKMAKDDEERMAEFVQMQVDREREKHKDQDQTLEEKNFTELQRNEEEEKIRLESLKFQKPEPSTSSSSAPVATPISKLVKPKDKEKAAAKRKASSKNEESAPSKKSAIEEIIEEENREKERKVMRTRLKTEDPWLMDGIVVKITSKAFGDGYYKQKAAVIEVINRFKAMVKLVSGSESLIKIDQNDVESVIPAQGRQVLIVQGKHRRRRATLKKLNVEKFSAVLQLEDDRDNLEVELPYEYFSKVI